MTAKKVFLWRKKTDDVRIVKFSICSTELPPWSHFNSIIHSIDNFCCQRPCKSLSILKWPPPPPPNNGCVLNFQLLLLVEKLRFTHSKISDLIFSFLRAFVARAFRHFRTTLQPVERTVPSYRYKGNSPCVVQSHQQWVPWLAVSNGFSIRFWVRRLFWLFSLILRLTP